MRATCCDVYAPMKYLLDIKAVSSTPNKCVIRNFAGLLGPSRYDTVPVHTVASLPGRYRYKKSYSQATHDVAVHQEYTQIRRLRSFLLVPENSWLGPAYYYGWTRLLSSRVIANLLTLRLHSKSPLSLSCLIKFCQYVYYLVLQAIY
jgi:hypothetical protein